MLVIPSGGSTDRQHIEPTFRAAEVFRPVTKWSTMVHSPREIPNALRRAYQAMRSGKPGPVMVEVSKDVFEEEFEGALSYTPVPKLRTAPDPDAIADAARLLLSAKNPLLWAGQGVIYAEAGDRLLALAEMLPAPIVCTNPGKSAVPDSHPLALGAAAHSRSKMFTDYLKRADLVCAIGSSLTRTPFGPGVPSGKKIIHCTNEARDINKDYDVDYALVGDAALVIDALIAEVGRQKKGESGKALTVLMDEIAQTKKAWQAEWTKHFESNEVPINQYRVLGELMKRPTSCV
jgi:acetolactate synthase-1/2/3 large subunit